MTQIASDTFVRGDNADLGAVWTPVPSNDSFKISANSAIPNTTFNDAAEVYSGAVFPDNQYVQVVLTNVGDTYTVDGQGIGLCLRGSTSENTYYRVVVSTRTNNLDVGKIVTGSFTHIETVAVAAFANGDTLRAEINGNVITTFKNGVQVRQTTDVASSIASGMPGVAFSSSGNNAALNTWEAGDLLSGDTQTRRFTIRRSRMTSW